MTTAQYLINKYGNITLTTKQLAEVLHMTPESLLVAVSGERLPVHTYKLGNRRVADVRDVAAYLDNQRKSA